VIAWPLVRIAVAAFATAIGPNRNGGRGEAAATSAARRTSMRPILVTFVLLLGCSARQPATGDPDASPPSDGEGSACRVAEQVCDDPGQCCDGLYCADNSLGHVCCGGVGSPCGTADGSDCCGSLACTDGVCGGRFDPAEPGIARFPVRGKHNTGYEAPSTGNAALWTCDDARSNSDFGGDHIGVDIWAARGTPVLATAEGTLVYTGFSSYSGNKVTIRTDGNWYHFMCHLDSIAPGMTNGKRVHPGDVVGYVGKTGTASNGVVHLHYSIYPDDNYNAGIDPWPYLHAVEWHVCE
jgi:hypothetical protein